MKKYVKKPMIVEAAQWDGTNDGALPIVEWVTDGGGAVQYRHTFALLDGANSGVETIEFLITTLEGNLTVSPWDWVIRGVQGEFYPCKPDIFAATYDADPGPPAKKAAAKKPAAKRAD